MYGEKKLHFISSLFFDKCSHTPVNIRPDIAAGTHGEMMNTRAWIEFMNSSYTIHSTNGCEIIGECMDNWLHITRTESRNTSLQRRPRPPHHHVMTTTRRLFKWEIMECNETVEDIYCDESSASEFIAASHFILDRCNSFHVNIFSRQLSPRWKITRVEMSVSEKKSKNISRHTKNTETEETLCFPFSHSAQKQKQKK